MAMELPMASLASSSSCARSLLPSCARAVGAWLRRRYSSWLHPEHACILPLHPQPQLCTGSQYSSGVFQLVAHYFPDRHTRPPRCIAIHADGADGAKAAEQLRSAGFEVTSLVLREQAGIQGGLLRDGGRRQCCLEKLAVGPEGQQVAAPTTPSVRADALVFADTMHLVDTRRALQAASRHLRRDGLLMCLWTDRDLASRFVLDVEELLEAAAPGFCRYDCQRDCADWVPRLQLGGLFRLIDYSCQPHTLTIRPAALLDLLASKAALHAALGSTRRRSFHDHLQRLIERHYGPQRDLIELPLHTKAYLLAKLPHAPAASPARGRLLQAGAGALEAERVCLFCGSPVED